MSHLVNAGHSKAVVAHIEVALCTHVVLLLFWAQLCCIRHKSAAPCRAASFRPNCRCKLHTKVAPMVPQHDACQGHEHCQDCPRRPPCLQRGFPNLIWTAVSSLARTWIFSSPASNSPNQCVLSNATCKAHAQTPHVCKNPD